jgi:dTMP kinase
MSQGLLVVFEGIDGSGKSTQRNMLAAWLGTQGIPCTPLAQPSGSLAGRMLRAAITAHRRLPPATELALFVRDRREQARSVITPLLRQGTVVLLDRHYLSSVAYQGALGLDPEEILRTCERFSPVADVTFLFDIDPTAALGRIRKTRTADPFERLEYLVRVRQLYIEWAPRVPHVMVIDATVDASAIQGRLREVVGGLVAARGLAPPAGGSHPISATAHL